MTETLEVTLELQMQEFTQFLGPNFEQNNWCQALYRKSLTTVQLPRPEKCENIPPQGKPHIIVPEQLLVQTTKGQWQQHPVVFLHYGTYEALKYRHGSLVVFLADRGYAQIPYDTFMGPPLEAFYEEAKRLGLTSGSAIDLRGYSQGDY
ncbi:MAG: hypothetical protein Q8L34_06215 [Candidatus Woesearchaeota archaeon]|nr:hypothetical protein [Candidatus Woesearchaeota archaeon]